MEIDTGYGFKDLMDLSMAAVGFAAEEHRDAFPFGNLLGAVYPVCAYPMNQWKDVAANVARAASGLFRGCTAVIVGCALKDAFKARSNERAYLFQSLLIGTIFLNRCAALLDNKVDDYFRSARVEM